MKRVCILATAICLALSGQTQPAQISGKIRVLANLTKRRISVPQVYERTTAVAEAPPASIDVSQELRRVVVYLEGAGLAAHPKSAVMDQKQRRFDPEFVAVPVGSTVKFPNSDPIFHNIFSLSKTKSFDLGNYSAGASRTVTFTQAGLVQVHCHLHPNMSGAVLVTPNDWFVEPDEKGDFKLPPVPPGQYTVIAWHKSAGLFRRKVDLSPGKTINLDFEIPITEAP